MSSRTVSGMPLAAVAIAMLFFSSSCGGPRGTSSDPAILAAELQEHVEVLAADAMQGRRAGTVGADRAARYLADELGRYGLVPMGDDGSYLQSFTFVSGVELGRANRMVAVGSGFRFAVDSDWRPLGFSGNGGGDFEVVFAGYGISAPEEGYDDYADLDVAGKAVLIMPYGPPSPEGGLRFRSQHPLRRKTVTARENGAAAVLFAPHPVLDPEGFLEPLRFDGTSSSARILAISVTGEVAQTLLGETARFDTLQQEIDEIGAPRSLVPGSEITLQVDVQQLEGTGYNVLGGLDAAGAGAPWLVIGAHYDHLGMGGDGSLAPDTVAVHNGADDNASGTAGLLELAQAFAAEPPGGTNILIAAFSAEEIGLIGSSYMASHMPEQAVPVEAMFNMDMVGRLNADGELTVYGTGTGDSLEALLESTNEAAEFRFSLSRIPDGYGPSDHSSFYATGIPVLHFFTGTHADYHRPSDDPATLNYAGYERIVRFVHRLVEEIDTMEEMIAYQTVASPQAPTGGRAELTVYTGVVPDMAYQGEGFRLNGVNEGSPAAMAGIRAGDFILRMGDRTINDIYDYFYALQEGSPGQRVEIEIRRGEQLLTVQIVLGNRRAR